MNFIEWLEAELRERDWTAAQLSRQAGLYPATVSRVLNGERSPGTEFCKAVALALNVPDEVVFRRAGLLDPLPASKDDPMLADLVELAKQLTTEERRRLTRVAELYLREQQEKYQETGDEPSEDDDDIAPPS